VRLHFPDNLIMCQCAQRRVAIREGVSALVSGDRLKALAAARFVVSSGRTDARAAVEAAKARLTRCVSISRPT
jgi:hypothetical protein